MPLTLSDMMCPCGPGRTQNQRINNAILNWLVYSGTVLLNRKRTESLRRNHGNHPESLPEAGGGKRRVTVPSRQAGKQVAGGIADRSLTGRRGQWVGDSRDGEASTLTGVIDDHSLARPFVRTNAILQQSTTWGAGPLRPRRRRSKVLGEEGRAAEVHETSSIHNQPSRQSDNESTPAAAAGALSVSCLCPSRCYTTTAF